jgi:ATP-dependent Clp protease adapter protein ClpS
MREPWFKRDSQRHDRYYTTPRQRSDEEFALALSTLPLYQVVLFPDAMDRAALAIVASPLTALIGQERAARVLAEVLQGGAGVVATCPRELAEHYCDELARRSLPCVITPA